VSTTTFCPKAKPLAGRMMCSCHGLARTNTGRVSTSTRAKSFGGSPSPSSTRLEAYHEAIATRRQREADEMAAALVAVLERIRSHQLKGWHRNNPTEGD
jgi:hypothetical protein